MFRNLLIKVTYYGRLLQYLEVLSNLGQEMMKIFTIPVHVFPFAQEYNPS